MSGPGWTFSYDVRPRLPPLAWLASIASGKVEVRCGASVVRTAGGFVEGTWVGPPPLGALVESTTVFGSAIVASADGLFVVPPSHTLEGLFLCRSRGGLMVSNSFVALLSAARLELDPSIAYPPLFILSIDGPERPLQRLPTLGEDVITLHYENLRVADSGELVVERRPREDPFASFADYRRRLAAALRSAIDNAAAYEPAAIVSSGYDGMAVAALAVEQGLRRALTLTSGRPGAGGERTNDSGVPAAQALGLEVEAFDRLDYLARTDLPEAEFLATGTSGEDVVFAAMELALPRTLLLSGHYGDLMWDRTYVGRRERWRGDMAGNSLGEFRLRVDFVHVPLPVFGRVEQPSLPPISSSPEMRPWSVGGDYDRPIARRLAEQAGVPRHTFGATKRAASGSLHQDGLAAFAPATRQAIIDFAAAEGSTFALPPRRWHRRAERALLRLARWLRAGPAVRWLVARRHARMTFDPAAGSLLLRWAVAVVRPRYGELASLGTATSSVECAPRRVTRKGDAAAAPRSPSGWKSE